MKKYFIGATILAVSSIVNAVPNMWQYDFIQGYEIYTISSSNNKLLRITCNSANGTRFTHDVELEVNEESYSNRYDPMLLSFLIDDTDVITPTNETLSYVNSENWYKLTSAFASAQKIEIYYKNKLETTIYPKNPQLLFDLKNCPSMLERTIQEQSEEEGKEYIPSRPLS
ncbi:hypothetical protein HX127_08820 [Acinetobacter sp. 256-1]|uniref:hypothetical protein n=1 Tax=Acinetobacter sp. 256-1 TaxID=2746721 RepID=UPI002577AB9C|nr:hypothetical protein [Acinetobacter sp. 256-1]MDM1757670.1 hypothetical protein [Acinetobacter sp. 256-1]